MSERIFGDIPGFPPGSVFASRLELARAAVHPPSRVGVSGTAASGAASIILSGAYEDDEDGGDVILYTGQGARDRISGRQAGDQLMRGSNLALARSCDERLPVRVIRRANPHSPYAPAAGYRYDGLYLIERYWRDLGRSGFVIWRFRLVALAAQAHSAG